MKSEGIIISSIDYKETSKIVHLYTKEGLLSVKVLGANNPKKGLLGFTTTGNTVSFVATDGKLPSLLEYDVTGTVFEITGDVKRVAAFAILLEVIRNIPEDSPHAAIYSYVEKVIQEIKTEEPKKLLSIFLIKMLYAFGIAPNLKSCVSCGSPLVTFINLDAGGAMCRNCCTLNNADELFIWKEYYFDKKDIKEYTACNYDALLHQIEAYYRKYTHIYLKIKSVL